MRQKNNIIIVLDGALTDTRHRRDVLKNRGWEVYFKCAIADGVEPKAAEYTTAMWGEGYRIHVLAIRPQMFRETTEKWLTNHFIAYHTLTMQPTRDYRKYSYSLPDQFRSRTKSEMLHDLGLTPENTLYVLDHPGAYEGWRRRGFKCFTLKALQSKGKSLFRWPRIVV